LVDTSLRLLLFRDPSDERHVSATHTTPERFTDLAFPPPELGRELDGRIEEPVIDGPHFDGDQSTADLAFRGPETGHAPYHRQAPKLRTDNNLVNSRTPSAHRRIGSAAASNSRARARKARLEYSGTGTTGSRSQSGARGGSYKSVNQALSRSRLKCLPRRETSSTIGI